ncbi:hypothetical protein M409DRAFT_24004 [Zasmidium cellare ATCC 36951]|uniref:MARVEL domain-containing protein n=1 Tax=Zasmidium cellare ATCC 36951 TaxID=1080233 RepID=A0A6A6CES4_ZASCE|nr:uncharacterized protein M409DRAFT_24004 [Zasmidium cellare ATCC 36951]KAF2165714.1 hypothetical protein M409DRAFT_24004 [Zasmidium cellare ATCC 36951]
MEKSKLALYITRVLQLISAAIVLGIGITLARDINTISHGKGCYQHGDPDDKIKCSDLVGRYPSSTAYAAFTGAFGLLDGILGLVGVVVMGVPWWVVVGVDALAGVFYLAGGVNSAVLRAKNSEWIDHQGLHIWSRFDTITAFMFIGFLVTLLCMALVFLTGRRRGKSSVV